MGDSGMQNKLEAIVGAIVLAVAVGFTFFAANRTGLVSTNAQSYHLYASFRSAEGVRIGTDVRLAGVKIGSVSDMELDPETYMARTELTISNAIDIPDDSAVTVSSEGLLGGNFIEVVPGGSMYAFDPMTEIEDTQSSVSLTTLLMRFVGSAASGN